VLKGLWLFLFAAQPNEYFSDGLKELEQRSHKYVVLKGEYVNTFFQSRSLLLSLQSQRFISPSYLFHLRGLLFGLFLDPEDGGHIFSRNIN
jgi:hypothetical protein